jgi:hypothetical protein
MNSGEAALEFRTSIVQSRRRVHYFSAVAELCTALGGGVQAQFSNHYRSCPGGRPGHLSPSWLASLRLTSVDKRPGPPLPVRTTLRPGWRAGREDCLFEEVKRSRVQRGDKFAGSEFGRACAPEGPTTGRRWSTMTRKGIGATRRPRCDRGSRTAPAERPPCRWCPNSPGCPILRGFAASDPVQ